MRSVVASRPDRRTKLGACSSLRLPAFVCSLRGLRYFAIFIMSSPPDWRLDSAGKHMNFGHRSSNPPTSRRTRCCSARLLSWLAPLTIRESLAGCKSARQAHRQGFPSGRGRADRTLGFVPHMRWRNLCAGRSFVLEATIMPQTDQSPCGDISAIRRNGTPMLGAH